jgi:hypothetical protein
MPAGVAGGGAGVPAVIVVIVDVWCGLKGKKGLGRDCVPAAVGVAL